MDRLRSGSLALLVLVALSCGPSSAQIRSAREAEYPDSAREAVFLAAREAMIENGYDLAYENPGQGVLVSTYRWYSKDGMAKSKETPRVREGDAVFRIGVELVATSRGLRVHVDGGAQGYTSGSPVAQQFKHGDPREPFWVEGKIDSLSLSIYNRLEAHRLPSVPAAK